MNKTHFDLKTRVYLINMNKLKLVYFWSQEKLYNSLWSKFEHVCTTLKYVLASLQYFKHNIKWVIEFF